MPVPYRAFFPKMNTIKDCSPDLFLTTYFLHWQRLTLLLFYFPAFLLITATMSRAAPWRSEGLARAPWWSVALPFCLRIISLLPYFYRMRRKKTWLILFLSLTVLNACIFFFRAHFKYHSYATYSSLYGPCDGDCRNKWEQYIHDFPPSELKEAKNITDPVVAGKKNTFEKATAIG